jgi:methenyltetrahydromethanopterin cyclohydrolase
LRKEYRLKKSPSVNKLAWRLLEELIEHSDLYKVKAEKEPHGPVIVDAGLEVKGGLQAGRIITEICMGGLGTARISPRNYDGLVLQSIFVWTDHPAISALGCQLAGWRINSDGYFAIGSGPARALALKPKEIYKEIKYEDESDRAVVVLETEKAPPLKIVSQIAKDCRVQIEKLAIILVPTTSLAGVTQVAGRIVETGLHKLRQLGLYSGTVRYAWGCAPIPPVHHEFVKAMGRTNDAILYGGTSSYTVESSDEGKLEEIVKMAPSSASNVYGRTFNEIFKEAKNDFYKIDPAFFAPATVVINNLKTGNTFESGEINVEMLKKSFGLPN